MKKRITIKDIAREAGVSPSTVSRVINNSAPVSEKLKKVVLDTIERMGYRPNFLARSLRKGSTGIFGFVVPDVTNPFFSLLIKGAEEFLKKHHISLIICDSSNNPREEIRILRMLVMKGIDGLLFVGVERKYEIFSELISNLKGVVLVDRILEGYKGPMVLSDNYGGMRQLIDYLIRTGHESFLFLGGDRRAYSTRERVRGFLDTVKEAGIVEYKILFGQYTYESGYLLTKKWIKEEKEIPDAIVCGNDLIAYGAIDALEEAGLHVPDNVSVTGFDDLPFSKHYKPALTTVRQPAYMMGFKAAKILFQSVSGKSVKEEVSVLETEVVIRESTKNRKINSGK